MKKVTNKVFETVTRTASMDSVRIFNEWPDISILDLVTEEANKPENNGLKVYEHKLRSEEEKIEGTEEHRVREFGSPIWKDVKKDDLEKYGRDYFKDCVWKMRKIYYLDIYFQ